MTLEAIKHAIIDLPEQQRTSLVAWINEQDSKAWDRQIEEDFSPAGAGMALLEKWDTEIKAGGSISLEEFLEQRDRISRTK